MIRRGIGELRCALQFQAGDHSCIGQSAEIDNLQWASSRAPLVIWCRVVEYFSHIASTATFKSYGSNSKAMVVAVSSYILT